MRVLVTGAAGMLGSALCPLLRGEGHQVWATDIDTSRGDVDFLDVRAQDAMAAWAERARPELIIHLAAETDLEKCETDLKLAYDTNTLGTLHAVQMARELDATLVYVSTAGVFDGRKTEPYTEQDYPNPINIYGRTKWGGELIAAAGWPKHFIVRAGWMIGGGDRDKKFVHKIIQQLEEGVERLHVVTDRIGTPTYVVDFSNCLYDLIQTQAYGLYHMCGGGIASRYNVAEKILEVLGHRDVELIPVTSDYAPLAQEYFVPRARVEVLLNTNLDRLGLNSMRPWQVTLAEYLETNFAYLKRG